MIGIIPAHAGSTHHAQTICECRKDHPRSRGEHVWSFRVVGFPPGSSPLTRGALLFSSLLFCIGRIIPAHAGSTSQVYAWLNPISGSSPLTRGAPDAPTAGGDSVGIIPAHAGSTMLRLTWRAPGQDHPRSRGEHGNVRSHAVAHVGSSPLTRGAQCFECVSFADLRIIPAHAGSTVATES